MTVDELLEQWPDAEDMRMRIGAGMVPQVRAAAPWRDGKPDWRPVVTLADPDGK